jgi:hypothetical protein
VLVPATATVVTSSGIERSNPVLLTKAASCRDGLISGIGSFAFLVSVFSGPWIAGRR